jgi:Spy/CpxP family protein refolding chaperone
MAETDELLAKARVEVGKLLTPEQMKKLPEPFQTNLKEKEGKKKKAGV